MEAVANPGSITMTLRHLGAAYNSATMEPPPPDGTRESGFGTYLISRSMDRVRYYHDERGRSCISLTKHRYHGTGGNSDGTGNR